MRKDNITQSEIDGDFFNFTLTVIERYSGYALDAHEEGEAARALIYECMAEGAYKLWVEVASKKSYGQYSKALLVALGR